MIYQKIIVNIPIEDMELIRKACEVDKRTISSITRKAVLNEAKKILKENHYDSKLG